MLNYQRFKEKVLENEIASDKEVKGFVVRCTLCTMILCLTLSVIASEVVGMLWVSFIILALSGFGFFSLLDLVSEDKDAFIKVRKLVKYWWLGIPISALLLVILNFTNLI